MFLRSLVLKSHKVNKIVCGGHGAEHGSVCRGNDGADERSATDIVYTVSAVNCTPSRQRYSMFHVYVHAPC